MNLKARFLLVLPAIAVGAAVPDPSEVISKPPSSDECTAEIQRDHSCSEIARQIHRLRLSVNETLPMLKGAVSTNAVAKSAPGSEEDWAEMLSAVINRNTNAVASGGQGTNRPAPEADTPAALQDLVLLRQHLQFLAPILDRLDSPRGSADQIAAPDDASRPANLSPTGRKSGSPGF